MPDKLLAVKPAETFGILRSFDPCTDAAMADFTEPGKLNLFEFMEANYMFNLPLAKFSYLTGRSLTTFKRDFKKAFALSPQRWLTQKRLALAHYQLTEKSRRPAELSLEGASRTWRTPPTFSRSSLATPPTALTSRQPTR